MSNLSNTPRLITARIDKGSVSAKSLYPIFASDNDFSENEEMYDDDTLELGYTNQAERVSTEIFEKFKDIEDESERLEMMVKEVFNVSGFIGCSNYYGEYEYEVIETEYEYIIVIATIM